MKTKTLFDINVILFLLVILIAVLVEETQEFPSLFERLNEEENAGIEKTDEFFRFKVVEIEGEFESRPFANKGTNLKEVYVSEPMSWEYMEQERIIVNGSLNLDEDFWNHKVVDELDVIELGPQGYFAYRIDLEAYY